MTHHIKAVDKNKEEFLKRVGAAINTSNNTTPKPLHHHQQQTHGEEEDRKPATEEQEREFTAYMKEYEEQNPIIDSYEKLLDRKQHEEKLKQNNEYMKVILERANRMKCQESAGVNIKDRLGKSSQFYFDVWEAMISESPAFLNADVNRKHRLLELLASRKSELTPAEVIIETLYTEFPELMED